MIEYKQSSDSFLVRINLTLQNFDVCVLPPIMAAYIVKSNFKDF